ncbi:uncharacterized protein LOC114365717, partial [Ostrinia furnacalis]|uniref:uncharacterized protein LOC114365717 n=1 Tax=Ostrinia furnacalis TaxID=93504 RepID=UPI0010393310
SVTAQEPWPDNVKLFQPYEVEQILLPDNASCLAVQAFLKMCNLPFEVEMRWNAEFMSPSGRVPFIKCGAFVVSELEPVVQFAANKGVSLCARLPAEEKAEMRAYMSLITNVLVNAELYISWLDDETFNAVTKVRNSSVYPWPLGWIQTRAKRNAVAKRLKALHWHDKSLEQVLADVEQCCNSLSQRLGERDYFFGTPTPLDALVYGHVRALLSAAGPKAALMIKPITSSLLRHLLRMVNLTNMKLSYQEEYLITQAFQITRRRMEPERTLSDRSTRVKRSKMSLRNASKENMFGFKPFASKQIIIMTSKEGHITCEYDGPKKYDQYGGVCEQNLDLCAEIIDELLNKVDEVSSEREYKHDFEVIVYPHEKRDEKFINLDVKVNDYLDTIEENDLSTETGPEDVLQIINDDDSDGLVNDKLLSTEIVGGDRITCISPDITDSSNPKSPNETFMTTSGDRTESMSIKSDLSNSPGSADSKSTLKMPSAEMSVESLLDYLRKRNATFSSHPSMADID